MKYAFYLEVERNLAGALPIAHHDEYIIAQHRVCSRRQILFELGLLIHTTTVIRASGPCRVWREIRALEALSRPRTCAGTFAAPEQPWARTKR